MTLTQKKQRAPSTQTVVVLLISRRLLYIYVQGHSFREDELADRSGRSSISATSTRAGRTPTDTTETSDRVTLSPASTSLGVRESLFLCTTCTDET